MAQRNKLPNRITSDKELAAWCYTNIPGFMGVIDRTHFRNKIKSMHPGNSVIINLDPGYKHGGTHWVAFRMSAEAPLNYYKDSFGAPPPNDIAAHCNCVYGNRIRQKLSEQNCGKRAAYWLRDIARAAADGRELEWFEASEL
jgi:hypothetical protein